MGKPAKPPEPRLKNMVFLSCAVHCVLLGLFFFIQGHQNSLPSNPLFNSTLVNLVNLNGLPGGGDSKATASALETKKEDGPKTPPLSQPPKKNLTARKKYPVAITSKKKPVSLKKTAVSTVPDSVTTVQPVSLVTSPWADSGSNVDSQISENSAIGTGATLALDIGSGRTGVGFGPGGSGRSSGSETMRDTYLMMIRSKIEQHKVYPRRASLHQIQGTVVVHFIITLEGKIKGVDVVQSSGFTLLDQAGLKAIKAASPFPKPPVEFFQNAVSIEVPIVFELT